MKIAINATSVGSGGGLTVARELSKAMAIAKPSWKVETFYRGDSSLSSEVKANQIQSNQLNRFIEYPLGNAIQRLKFELASLPRILRSEDFDACINLNGMLLGPIPTLKVCHFQDPWPYRPEAWTKKTDFLVAWIKRRIHRYSRSHADLCTFTSQYLQNEIINGLDSVNTLVVYNGIPEDWLAGADQVAPIESRHLQIVTVSDVNLHKRQMLVVRAVAELKKLPQYENVQYRIAGNIFGESRSQIESFINANNLQSNIFLEGRVSDQRIVDLLKESRVKVLMSVCESFGIPCIEAMAYGCPVVVSDSCALPEVVGGAAKIVPSDNLSELVMAIRELLENDTSARYLQRQGIARCKEFSWLKSGAVLATKIERLQSSKAKRFKDLS